MDGKILLSSFIEQLKSNYEVKVYDASNFHYIEITKNEVSKVIEYFLTFDGGLSIRFNGERVNIYKEPDIIIVLKEINTIIESQIRAKENALNVLIN